MKHGSASDRTGGHSHHFEQWREAIRLPPYATTTVAATIPTAVAAVALSHHLPLRLERGPLEVDRQEKEAGPCDEACFFASQFRGQKTRGMRAQTEHTGGGGGGSTTYQRVD